MKVCVSYDVTFEVDVPEEEVKQALADDYDNSGRTLRRLAEKYKPAIVESLNVAEGANMIGFYQAWIPVEGGGYALQDEDLDEVIWEG